MVRVVRAVPDGAISARVVTRRALHYREGADAVEDRPRHVRAGSGLAFVGGRLAVVQDDASFVALVDRTTWDVDCVCLPRGEGGLRQFDEGRGNKRHKMDLEACVAADVDGAPALLAFGSGSTSERERLAIVQTSGHGLTQVRLVDAHPLYAALRARRDFSGSELNIEGAVLDGDSLRLFQRGNGRPTDDEAAVNATVDVAWRDVLSLLRGQGPAWELSNVVQYELGTAGNLPLSFTDATLAPGGATLYLATAEDSPDTFHDGAVVGNALGVIVQDGARFTPIVDIEGKILLDKAEGVALDPTNSRRAFVVLDADDAARPSELCEVELQGSWGLADA